MVAPTPLTAGELEAAVRDALCEITVGEGGPDLVSAGHVAAVAATGGAVRILIDPEHVDDTPGEALAVLLDADVYGPSAPHLLGVSARAESTGDGSRIAPIEAHGLKVMSLGFMMPDGKALAWRGSLVDEGLPQLISDVDWGDLDILVVDLPPGTSDVHLALARTVPIAGVLAVSGSRRF